ncbi:MAG: hypothetical protein HC781_08240 [Leptolyngbyaceae cyanobacterium CSU_1_4]|nr:hypothetical protein [Leptolyngbyaceae cyanobacterium CSU_1_4]
MQPNNAPAPDRLTVLGWIQEQWRRVMGNVSWICTRLLHSSLKAIGEFKSAQEVSVVAVV